MLEVVPICEGDKDDDLQLKWPPTIGGALQYINEPCFTGMLTIIISYDTLYIVLTVI